MNDRLLEGVELTIIWTRFDKNKKEYSNQRQPVLMKTMKDRSKQWRESHRDEMSFKDVLINGICNKNLLWLENSLMMHSKCPIDIVDVMQLLNIWEQKIKTFKDMGEFKFIITFRTQQDHDWALNMATAQFISKCMMFRKWFMEEDLGACRDVWIQFMGLPPQA